MARKSFADRPGPVTAAGFAWLAAAIVLLPDVRPSLATELSEMSMQQRRARILEIRETRPERRDTPLREINISDLEVAEIEAVTQGVLPGSIVNIAGIVVGCPCQNGPTCKDEVWVTAIKGPKGHGLQLSRIDEKWVIGPLQRWWMRYDALQRLANAVLRSDDADRLERYQAIGEEILQHYESLPACDANPITQALAAEPASAQ